MRILIVDDDALAGAMTAAILDDAGHQTMLVDCAQGALGALAGGRFAIVVCDLHMPGMSGIELLRHLRGAGNAIPFVLLSGDPPDQALRQEPALGACLPKDEHLEHTLPKALAELAGPGPR